jgi:hypothetical protein
MSNLYIVFVNVNGGNNTFYMSNDGNLTPGEIEDLRYQFRYFYIQSPKYHKK